MTLAAIQDSIADAFADVVPRLVGGLLLLVLGLLGAWILGRLGTRALRTVGLDRLADRFGIHDVLARIGLEPSLSHG